MYAITAFRAGKHLILWQRAAGSLERIP